MRIPRIFTDQRLREQTHIKLEAEPARHLERVLRKRTHTLVCLFNGDGREYKGRIAVMDKTGVSVEILNSCACPKIPSLKITLIQGISKGDRMDYALQKSVELGVNRIVTVFTHRSVVRLDHSRRARRMEHWRNIVIGACEQSGRCDLPTLENSSDLDSALSELPEKATKLVLHKDAASGLGEVPQPNREVVTLVGPEGGLDDAERDLAINRGFIPVQLGPRILRSETAPVAAVTALQILWGDFR